MPETKTYCRLGVDFLGHEIQYLSQCILAKDKGQAGQARSSSYFQRILEVAAACEVLRSVFRFLVIWNLIVRHRYRTSQNLPLKEGRKRTLKLAKTRKWEYLALSARASYVG